MDIDLSLSPARMPRRAGWWLGLTLLLALVLSGFLAAAQGSTASMDDGLDHFVFFPLVARSLPPGIHGRVTCQGEAATGVTVTLFLHDTESRYPTAFRYTQTQADGDYHFTDVAPLPPCCAYHVGYQNGKAGNPLNPAHLMVWNAPTIPSYEVGQSVSVADFDVADVRQLSPTAGVTVTSPVSFTWEPRLVTPQDRYYCGVFMPGYMYGQGEVYWRPASADGVCVWEAPDAGFDYNADYEWYLQIMWFDDGGVDGGMGSGFARPLHFHP